MKIITRCRFDWDRQAWIDEEWFDYKGPLSMAKGGNSKQEQANADQQRQLENQTAQQQLALQQGQIGMVDPTLQSIIANGGMLPAQEAAMTSLVTNNLANTYRQGIGGINNALVARGISGGQTGAGGGAAAQDFGALTAALGNQQQQGLSQIQVEKGQGLNQALNTALGVGGMYGQNVGTFNQGASSALGSGVQAANNADQASTSLLGPLIGGLTGLGGAAIQKKW